MDYMLASVVIALIVLIATAIPRAVSETPVRIPRNTVVLFWTGGVASTLRLCELLINENKRVQPIYIYDSTLDRIPGGARDNLNISHMDAIVTALHCKYPHTRETLARPLYLRNVRLDKSSTNTMELLHHLGFTARSANQYAYIAQVITDFAINHAEVGVVIDRPEMLEALQDRIREVNWSHAIKPDCASLYDNHKFVDRSRLEEYWFNKLPYTQTVVESGNQPSSWGMRRGCAVTNAGVPTYSAHCLRRNDLFNYADSQGYGDIIRIATVN